jgi:hypothetical protein
VKKNKGENFQGNFFASSMTKKAKKIRFLAILP